MNGANQFSFFEFVKFVTLTLKSIHRFSMIEPQQPRNGIRNTMNPITIIVIETALKSSAEIENSIKIKCCSQVLV